MFKSSTETLIRYRRERFRWRVFGPVAVVLTVAAIPAPLLFPLSFLAVMLVLFQFRLWDDLADRDYDPGLCPWTGTGCP